MRPGTRSRAPPSDARACCAVLCACFAGRDKCNHSQRRFLLRPPNRSNCRAGGRASRPSQGLPVELVEMVSKPDEVRGEGGWRIARACLLRPPSFLPVCLAAFCASAGLIRNPVSIFSFISAVRRTSCAAFAAFCSTFWSRSAANASLGTVSTTVSSVAGSASAATPSALASGLRVAAASSSAVAMADTRKTPSRTSELKPWVGWVRTRSARGVRSCGLYMHDQGERPAKAAEREGAPRGRSIVSSSCCSPPRIGAAAPPLRCLPAADKRDV